MHEENQNVERARNPANPSPPQTERKNSANKSTIVKDTNIRWDERGHEASHDRKNKTKQEIPNKAGNTKTSTKEVLRGFLIGKQA